MPVHLHIFYGCCPATTTELNIETEAEWPAEPRAFLIWLFIEKGCQPLIQGIRASISTLPRKPGWLFSLYHTSFFLLPTLVLRM